MWFTVLKYSKCMFKLFKIDLKLNKNKQQKLKVNLYHNDHCVIVPVWLHKSEQEHTWPLWFKAVNEKYCNHCDYSPSLHEARQAEGVMQIGKPFRCENHGRPTTCSLTLAPREAPAHGNYCTSSDSAWNPKRETCFCACQYVLHTRE